MLIVYENEISVMYLGVFYLRCVEKREILVCWNILNYDFALGCAGFCFVFGFVINKVGSLGACLVRLVYLNLSCRRDDYKSHEQNENNRARVYLDLAASLSSFLIFTADVVVSAAAFCGR